MSKRSDQFLLEDIIESINKIERYTEGLSKDQFQKDEMRLDAVIRNFEIIGEAANRLSKEIYANYPDVKWRRMVGFRNRIVHEYFGIDFDILWSIVEKNLTELKGQILQIKENT